MFAYTRTDLEVEVPDAIQFGRKMLPILEAGTTRAVYAGKNVVVKVQLLKRGQENLREYQLFKKFGKNPDPKYPSYARCRLLSNGWLVMEKVVSRWDLEAPMTPPEWVFDDDDGGQAGLDHKKRWVMYDYAG